MPALGGGCRHRRARPPPAAHHPPLTAHRPPPPPAALPAEPGGATPPGPRPLCRLLPISSAPRGPGPCGSGASRAPGRGPRTRHWGDCFLGVAPLAAWARAWGPAVRAKRGHCRTQETADSNSPRCPQLPTLPGRPCASGGRGLAMSPGPWPFFSRGPQHSRGSAPKV